MPPMTSSRMLTTSRLSWRWTRCYLTLVFQDDATYRLNWHGFPVFISGCSTPTGKFFPTHTTLQSHEDTRAYKNVYNYVKEEVGTPRLRMGDGAKEITSAGEQVLYTFV